MLLGVPRTCQEFRERNNKENEAWLIDPDGSGPNEPLMVFCEMEEETEIGITVSYVVLWDGRWNWN